METVEEKVARVVKEEVAVVPYDPRWADMFEQERLQPFGQSPVMTWLPQASWFCLAGISPAHTSGACRLLGKETKSVPRSLPASP
jgi:hypothetical protein